MIHDLVATISSVTLGVAAFIGSLFSPVIPTTTPTFTPTPSPVQVIQQVTRTVVVQATGVPGPQGPKGDKGDPGGIVPGIANVQGPAGFQSGSIYPTATYPNAGTIGGVTYFGSKELTTETLTATGVATLGGLIAGSANLGATTVSSLNIAGPLLLSGDATLSGLEVSGIASISNTLYLPNDGTAEVRGDMDIGGTLQINGDLIGNSKAFLDSASISSNFEVSGISSASYFVGGGLGGGCNGGTSKLLYDAATHLFSCGTDAGASGQTIDVGELGISENPVSSISFNPAHFAVSFTSPQALISLDWGPGGPASLSQNETVTGAWTFSGAPTFNALATFNNQISVANHAAFGADASVSGTLEAGTLKGDGQQLTLARIGASTYSTVQDLQNIFHSSGWVSGGNINDLGGNAVAVAAGTGLIRDVNSATATVFYFDWPASNSLSIPIGVSRFIGIDYNSGSPKVVAHALADWNNRTNFPLGRAVNEGGLIHVEMDPFAVGDHAANMIQRDYETMPLAVDMRDGGLMIDESGDGNRFVTMTAGALWDRLNRYTIGAFNSGTGGTFDRYYRDGSSGFTKESTQVQWPNSVYDNNSGVLATMTAGKYAVLWFYLETDGNVVMLYGRGQYVDAEQAQQEQVPDTLPDRLTVHGRLIGRLIFQKNAAIAAAVQSAFTQGFNPFFPTEVLTVGQDGSFFSVSSLSFDENVFNVNFNGTSASISLDWVNGPASRSIAQSITGLWTFTNASVSNNFEISGTASVSQLLANHLTLTTASTSGIFEASVLKATTLGSDGTLTINPSTLLIARASVSGGLEVSGALTASSSFLGAGLTTCNGVAQKLTWSGGSFGCGVDQTSGGSGASTLEVREFGVAYDSMPATLSFDAGKFNLTASGSSDVIISLDWVNGPASRSATQTITGAWTFNALTKLAIASASQVFGAGLSSCSDPSQKLLYNNSTGMFSCGSDAGAGGVSEIGGVTIETPHDIEFDAGGFNVIASGGIDAVIRLDYANGPASRSIAQTITGAWLFTAASSQFSNTLEITTASVSAATARTLTVSGQTSLANASASGTFEATALKADSLSNSTGTLTLGAFTLSGLVTGNNQTITGVSQFNFTNASGSVALEATTLKASTLGADAGLTISPTGQLTLTPGTRTQINGAASVSTNFEVAGYTSASQMFGAGLTNCTGANFLQWSSATGKFSCVSASPDTATFTDTTPGTMADNNTNELFNDTPRPNITPTNAAQTVLVSAHVKFTAGGGGDTYSAVRIVHQIGSAPSCSTSVQVGDSFATFMTNTGDSNDTSATFLDTPGTTSQTFYTVCASANSVLGNTPTVDRIDVVLTVLGADIAENYYTSDDSIQSGDVVAIDGTIPAGIKKSSGSYDSQVLGVVSSAPKMTLDDAIGFSSGRPVPVALVGRIPVKVSTENGPIKAGDYLAPASLPGYAMKATAPGPIIGQSLQDYTADNPTGYVIMFVKNAWYNGDSTQAFAPNDSLFASILNYLKDAVLSVKALIADSVTTKKLCLDDVCVNRDQLKELLDRNRIAAPVDTPTPTPEITPTESPIPSDTPTPEIISTPTPTPTETPMPTDTPAVVASGSAG